MKRFKKYIYMLLLGGMALTSCSQDELATPDVDKPVVTDGVVRISGSIAVPGMEISATRGGFGEKPNSDLKLTLLEFSAGTNASNSFLTNIYQARTTSTTAVENGGIVKFTVELKLTTEPRVLHLMVADNYVHCNYGSEAEILPMITVGSQNNSGREAYWGRSLFEAGYAEIDADGNPELRDDVVPKLTAVPVIRNFCKVSVENRAGTTFELYGFQLVNVPTSGTIAPYSVAAQGVPDLLDGNRMLGYDEASAVYEGIVPANAGFRNQESELRSLNSSAAGQHTLWSKGAAYMYEHPFESARRTYMIVQGRYKNADNTTIKDYCYYKIDLGAAKNDGMFSYMNLLRNYNYNVVINSVKAPGYSTPSEAIDGTTFNNLSASVETKAMLNVSDGTNMLIVNATSHVFVTDRPSTFMYRYIKNVGAGQTEDNSVPRIVGLTEGEVVKSFSGPVSYTDAQGVNWMAVTITPNAPDASNKTQQFTVVDENGLGRTISLVLHNPWNYNMVNVYPGTSNKRPDAGEGTAGAAAGDPLTVYFNLPDGLPEEMFPLRFQLEANPQNIENNPIGTLVVSTGPSLFESNNGVPAISYVKTVSWKEYNYLYIENGGNDVDISKPNPNHTVRCRFRTITEGTGKTDVIIHNPYFVDASATFTRL